MAQRVIYVMTHDSIGLGEDGPTHQPIEHLAALRAMPNLNVFRPADPIETAECWELALKASGTPAILALTRQAVPALRKAGAENLCAKGAYVLAETAGKKRDITILATGSEVGIAVEARDARAGRHRRPSCRCPPGTVRGAARCLREVVLGGRSRVAVGGGRVGWSGAGEKGASSACRARRPAPRASSKHFGITAANIADAARKLLSQ
jgi:transketolase